MLHYQAPLVLNFDLFTSLPYTLLSLDKGVKRSTKESKNSKPRLSMECQITNRYLTELCMPTPPPARGGRYLACGGAMIQSSHVVPESELPALHCGSLLVLHGAQQRVLSKCPQFCSPHSCGARFVIREERD